MALDRAEQSSHEHRTETRDEVHHRAQGLDLKAGGVLALLVVNMSPHGLMARCDAPLAVGARIRLTLPGVGVRVAEVRWSLGGRIGCQFDQPIAPQAYASALWAMR